MEHKSEQIVEITMSDIASSDEEVTSEDGKDNRINTENVYLVNTNTEPPDEENLNNVIIKTENIKQEIINNEDTWSNQKQLNILIKEPVEDDFKDDIITKIEENNNNNEDTLSNQEQLNVLIKQEFDDMEFSDNYLEASTKKYDYEEINDEKFTSCVYSRLKHELILDKDNQAKSNPKSSNTKKLKRKLRCKHCDYITYQKYSLKKHAMIHKDPIEQIWYHCTNCSYKTLQKGHLKRHDAIHKPASEVTYFTCAICEYKFKQKCTLRRHVKDVHCAKSKDSSNPNPLDQELFECAQCTYSTYRRSLLTSHMDKHKDVQYICDICSFSTKYRRNLRVHLEIHGVVKELQVFECNICKFQTRMGYCLKRHFLSKKHLAMVGKINEYSPRPMKMKEGV